MMGSSDSGMRTYLACCRTTYSRMLMRSGVTALVIIATYMPATTPDHVAVEPDDAAWHRRVATDTFNRTWELLEHAERSPAEDREMLVAAFTSRYHWEQVGGPEEWWVGDWQIARVAAALGEGSLALRYATNALDGVERAGWGGWRLASAREGMARAHAAAGSRAERDRFVLLADEALRAETDDEDRAIIAGQLTSVPTGEQ
jgi:hypothetical protein